MANSLFPITGVGLSTSSTSTGPGAVTPVQESSWQNAMAQAGPGSNGSAAPGGVSERDVRLQVLSGSLQRSLANALERIERNRVENAEDDD